MSSNERNVPPRDEGCCSECSFSLRRRKKDGYHSHHCCSHSFCRIFSRPVSWRVGFLCCRFVWFSVCFFIIVFVFLPQNQSEQKNCYHCEQWGFFYLMQQISCSTRTNCRWNGKKCNKMQGFITLPLRRTIKGRLLYLHNFMANAMMLLKSGFE